MVLVFLMQLKSVIFKEQCHCSNDSYLIRSTEYNSTIRFMCIGSRN
jgi:hypothetical protein